jgi:hypothetical protein
MNQRSLLLAAVCILAGCSTVLPGPPTADNPASPLAAEASEHAPRNSLAADALTKKTHRILSQADKSQEQPSPTPEQQQTDQMPGMKMQ